MDEQAVEACGKDQALLDKIKADQTFAFDEAIAAIYFSGCCGSCGIAAKVRPIRFRWIQAIRHSWTEEPLAMTRRNRGGTKAGFSISMAAPSSEIFRTMQLITEPPDDT